MRDRPVLAALDESSAAFRGQRGITVRHEGRSFRWFDPPRQRPISTLRHSRDASGPELLFIQAEIGAVVRGVKAGDFDYPT
ncbi:MAG: hypothetical protein ACR2KL_13685 [Nocardioidaceae bacterium]